MLKWFSYLSSSDINIASCVRRILHSMLLMIYEWPNQLKLWYMDKPCQILISFYLMSFWKKSARLILFVKMMGSGSSHNLHLQLYRICDSTGNLTKLSSLVETMYVICTYSLLYWYLTYTLQEIAWTGQRLKAYYSAGGILWIFCGAAILLLPRSMSALMYIISIFIGIANALMTVWPNSLSY